MVGRITLKNFSSCNTTLILSQQLYGTVLETHKTSVLCMERQQLLLTMIKHKVDHSHCVCVSIILPYLGRSPEYTA